MPGVTTGFIAPCVMAGPGRELWAKAAVAVTVTVAVVARENHCQAISELLAPSASLHRRPSNVPMPVPDDEHFNPNCGKSIVLSEKIALCSRRKSIIPGNVLKVYSRV